MLEILRLASEAASKTAFKVSLTRIILCSIKATNPVTKRIVTKKIINPSPKFSITVPPKDEFKLLITTIRAANIVIPKKAWVGVRFFM